MGLTLPAAISRKLDGVPLLGLASLAAPRVQLSGDSLRIRWTALGTGKPEKVKVWLTTTSRFKNGGTDMYLLLGTVPLAWQGFNISRAKVLSIFVKIVLEGEHNTVNRWLMPPGSYPTPTGE